MTEAVHYSYCRGFQLQCNTTVGPGVSPASDIISLFEVQVQTISKHSSFGLTVVSVMTHRSEVVCARCRMEDNAI